MLALAPTSGPTVLAVTPKLATSSFGDYLRQLMRVAGYENVAALAKESGVSHANIGRWIDGATPSVDALRRVAPFLGVRLGDLMIRAGIATREELGMVGAPPTPGPSLPTGLRSFVTKLSRAVNSRLADPALSDRAKRSLVNQLEWALGEHLDRVLTIFDDVIEETQNAPREPRMRRR